MSEDNRNYEAAVAAANWWAEQIGAPRFDNGDKSETGGLTMMMATVLASDSPFDSGTAERFVTELAAIIVPRLEGSTYGVSLNVDYGPCMELGSAAEKAGVSLTRFPWKTRMSVHSDHITASSGYGATPKLVWSAPEWIRPGCSEHRIELQNDTYVYFDDMCAGEMYHDGDHDFSRSDTRICNRCNMTYAGHNNLPYEERLKTGHSYFEPIAESVS